MLSFEGKAPDTSSGSAGGGLDESVDSPSGLRLWRIGMGNRGIAQRKNVSGAEAYHDQTLYSIGNTLNPHRRLTLDSDRDKVAPCIACGNDKQVLTLTKIYKA
jgi:hypothetical protein